MTDFNFFKGHFNNDDSIFFGGWFSDNVRQVFFALNSAFAVKPQVVKFMDSAHSIQNEMQSSLNSAFTVKALISNDIRSAYSIRTRINFSKNGAFQVKKIILNALNSAYPVKAITAKRLESAYSIQQETVSNKNMAYKIQITISNSLNSAFGIKTKVTKSVHSAYMLKAKISLGLNSAYKILVERSHFITSLIVQDKVASRQESQDKLGSIGSVVHTSQIKTQTSKQRSSILDVNKAKKTSVIVENTVSNNVLVNDEKTSILDVKRKIGKTLKNQNGINKKGLV
ncbi:MAG: hypothetical protein K8823_1554 [Cenarchaeum symbiont of Oopsacas minuta]|nr:hypothetical protein [Cenarchaeum symbiont of Oopsacas minuta]